MTQRDERRQRVSARKQAAEHKSGFDRTAVRIPEGVNSFVAKSKQYNLEFIVYQVPEDKVGNPNHEPGDLAYTRHYYVHRGIGPNDDMYICPAKTVGMPCPICEEVKGLIRRTPAGDKEGQALILSLKPKERQLWNVMDLDAQDRGVQVWDISFHNFGKQLNARILNSPESKGYEYFADPVDGLTVSVGFADKSIGVGKPFPEASSIDFERRGPLSQDWLEAAQVLDDLLIVPGYTRNAEGEFVMSYNRLKEIFLTGEASEEGEEGGESEGEAPAPSRAKMPPAGTRPAPAAGTAPKPAPAAKPAPAKPVAQEKARPTAESKGIAAGTVVEYRGKGDCEVRKVTGEGFTLTLLDLTTDDIYKDVAVSDTRVKGTAAKTEAPAPAKAAEPAKPAAKSAAKPAQPKPKPAPEPEPEPAEADENDWGEDTDDTQAAPAGAETNNDDWDAGWSEE